MLNRILVRGKLIISILIFCMFASISFAGCELVFYYNNQQTPFPNGTTFLWENSGKSGFDIYIKNKKNFTLPAPEKLSNQSAALWIKLPITSFDNSQNIFLDIPNSHINQIQVFQLGDDDELLDSSLLMGDHHAFSFRSIHFPEIIIPLKDPKVKYALLYLDKRNEPFFTSIQVLDQVKLEHRKTKYLLLSGLLLGILFAAFIINLYIVINANSVINYLYSLFLGLSIIYTLSDFGYIHWIINYNSSWIIDIIRPLSLSIAFPVYLFFFINTISFKEHYPKWANKIRIYAWIWLWYVLIASSISPWLYDNSYKYYSLAISLVFQQFTLVIVIATSVITLRKKDRYAIPFLIASFLFLLTHFQYIGHRFGYIDDSVTQQHFVPIILGMDCLIMGGIVALRFIEFIQKNKSLEFALISKDRELGERIAEVQLRELSRISQMLHNHIGIALMSLKVTLENNKKEIPDKVHIILTEQTQRLIEDVRQTAHFLSPQTLRKFGLAHCIQLFVKEICKAKDIEPYIEVTNECNLTSTNIQLVVLLIIQECVNNTIKHSKANNIKVQCFVENNHFYISYEDDGIGFDENNLEHQGIGLIQIQEMINVCSGKCSITSIKNQGFQLNAEIPLLQ